MSFSDVVVNGFIYSMGRIGFVVLFLFWAAVSRQTLAASGSQVAEWPMFRGGPSLSGVSPGGLNSELALRWRFKTQGPVKSSAAIAGGRVFVGSDDQQLYALELVGGKTNWTFRTQGPVESSPLVLNDRVYVGSSDAWLYAV